MCSILLDSLSLLFSTPLHSWNTPEVPTKTAHRGLWSHLCALNTALIMVETVTDAAFPTYRRDRTSRPLCALLQTSNAQDTGRRMAMVGMDFHLHMSCLRSPTRKE